MQVDTRAREHDAGNNEKGRPMNRIAALLSTITAIMSLPGPVRAESENMKAFCAAAPIIIEMTDALSSAMVQFPGVVEKLNQDERPKFETANADSQELLASAVAFKKSFMLACFSD